MAFQNNARTALEKYDIKPNKILGQNFLIDESTMLALVNAAKVGKNDVVVEVGPGTGNITRILAERARRVIAIEKDRRLLPILEEKLMKFQNVEIIHGDILNFNPSDYQLKTTSYKLIGAPPYYLTAHLFRCFLEDLESPPNAIALIIQKEVAQKITAKPPRMNLLAVSVQLYGAVKIEKIIKKGAFWPQPKVDSAVLTVKNIEKPADIDEKIFFKLVRAGFSSPRKQLAANFAAKFEISRGEVEIWLAASDIKATLRAEALALNMWRKLYTNKPSVLSG